MNQCLCCNARLIKHLNQTKMYWFCPSCHQEMPNIVIGIYCLEVEKQLTNQK